MAERSTPDTTYESLPDPWESDGAIILNGVLERNRYSPLLVGFFALILGFAAYMIIGNVATIVFLMMDGVSLEAMLQDLPGVIESHTGALLSANAVGLFLGMGAVALLLTRFHTTRLWAFLRLRKPDPVALLLALIGLLAFIPIVQWAGSINQSIPLPEWLRAMEDVQMELLEKVLQGDIGVLLSLVLVAVTPALCEEVFFRGYLQRHFERGFGIVGGIVATGFIFGLFHLRLTQLLPLSLLGIYLAYLTWRTGSLWIPIVIHFANNAIAVATAEFVKNRPDMAITDLEEITVPWYIVVLGLVAFSGILYVLHDRTQKQKASPAVVSEE